MENWVNFGEKEGHTNVQHSAVPGLNPGPCGWEAEILPLRQPRRRPKISKQFLLIWKEEIFLKSSNYNFLAIILQSLHNTNINTVLYREEGSIGYMCKGIW